MSKEKENSLAIIDENALAAVEGIFDVNDNIKGVKGRIPQIKMVHQAQMFKDNADNKFESFEGIILHHSPANAYWDKSFEETGGGVLPDCFSLDGSHPVATEGKKTVCASCHNCPMNQFGSDKRGGRGKACKNMWRLHILVQNQAIPKRVTLPPSSIPAVQDFLVDLRDKKVPHEIIPTEFRLKATKNKDGITYSEIVFKPLWAKIIKEKDDALALKKIKEDFSYAFGEVIEAEEYVSAEA